ARTRSPAGANEYPVAPIGVQPYSSTEILARVIGSWDETKNDASLTANVSGSTAPSSLARAYTRFFCESVGSTLELSPVRWVPSRSPESDVDTFQSRITSEPPGPPPRPTGTTRISALPYRLAPTWTMVTPPCLGARVRRRMGRGKRAGYQTAGRSALRRRGAAAAAARSGGPRSRTAPRSPAPARPG